MVNSFHSILQVRSARMDLGLTRSQLALMCGLKPSLIAEFEYGERPICRATYEKIINTLSRAEMPSA
ncbi:MAG: helix-turn-helix domain-containing protein [Selenomonas sp.]|uniref:helix-turn-helix domain-containing protein n=1 Tax=Selenomonas sp. TaxID=2053611 RepID=UPI0025E404CA|nr:helix-turn-helix transcriptional regulator [Selenomonas sp.]MCR5756675.1 helix-turn-helix domain-containing protein [Selenomonas sp.]